MLTDDGIHIPPAPNEPVCDDYDPAGPGAGLESDNYPQCASCGWPKTYHRTQPPARA